MKKVPLLFFMLLVGAGVGTAQILEALKLTAMGAWGEVDRAKRCQAVSKFP